MCFWLVSGAIIQANTQHLDFVVCSRSDKVATAMEVA